MGGTQVRRQSLGGHGIQQSQTVVGRRLEASDQTFHFDQGLKAAVSESPSTVAPVRFLSCTCPWRVPEQLLDFERREETPER